MYMLTAYDYGDDEGKYMNTFFQLFNGIIICTEQKKCFQSIITCCILRYHFLSLLSALFMIEFFIYCIIIFLRINHSNFTFFKLMHGQLWGCTCIGIFVRGKNNNVTFDFKWPFAICVFILFLSIFVLRVLLRSVLKWKHIL